MVTLQIKNMSFVSNICMITVIFAGLKLMNYEEKLKKGNCQRNEGNIRC